MKRLFSLKFKLILSYMLISLLIIYMLMFVTEIFYDSNDDNIELINSMQLTHMKVGVGAFILSILVGFYLAFNIAKPLEQINVQTKKIKDGDYDLDLKVDTNIREVLELKESVDQLSKTLKENEKVKQEMLNNYSHEIRTPLMCLLSTFEGMADGLVEINEKRVHDMYEEIKELVKVVDSVDNLMEYQYKEGQLNKSKFNLLQVLNKVLLNFESSFLEKNIDIDFEYEEDELYIYADEDKIRSLFTNLISNACKYTDKNGKVYIKIELVDDKYIIKIKDTGIGISKNDLDNIFKNLYRVDKSRVKEIEGLGIGLYICKNIVLAHKGKIFVESELGVGSEFTIIINKF